MYINNLKSILNKDFQTLKDLGIFEPSDLICQARQTIICLKDNKEYYNPFKVKMFLGYLSWIKNSYFPGGYSKSISEILLIGKMLVKTERFDKTNSSTRSLVLEIGKWIEKCEKVFTDGEKGVFRDSEYNEVLSFCNDLASCLKSVKSKDQSYFGISTEFLSASA